MSALVEEIEAHLGARILRDRSAPSFYNDDAKRMDLQNLLAWMIPLGNSAPLSEHLAMKCEENGVCGQCLHAILHNERACCGMTHVCGSCHDKLYPNRLCAYLGDRLDVHCPFNAAIVTVAAYRRNIENAVRARDSTYAADTENFWHPLVRHANVPGEVRVAMLAVMMNIRDISNKWNQRGNLSAEQVLSTDGNPCRLSLRLHGRTLDDIIGPWSNHSIHDLAAMDETDKWIYIHNYWLPPNQPKCERQEVVPRHLFDTVRFHSRLIDNFARMRDTQR